MRIHHLKINNYKIDQKMYKCNSNNYRHPSASNKQKKNTNNNNNSSKNERYKPSAACLVMLHDKYVHRNHLNIQFEEYITHALSVYFPCTER